MGSLPLAHNAKHIRLVIAMVTCAIRNCDVRVGKSGKSGISRGKGEGHVVDAGVNCVCNMCGSAHSCGCVVKWQFC